MRNLIESTFMSLDEMLISRGADVNISLNSSWAPPAGYINRRLYTPLICVVESGKEDIVEKLVSGGAKVNKIMAGLH